MNIMLGSDIDLLKIPLSIISKTVEEITLEFDTEGLHINCIDREHVQYSTLFISQESFEIYDIEEDTSCSVDCTKILKAVNKAHGDEYIKICVDNTINVLKIDVVNDATGTRKQYNIRTIDSNYATPQQPKMELPISFEVDAKEFQQSIKDITLDKIDRVQLEIKEDTLRINTQSEFELNNITMRLDINQTEEAIVSYDFDRLNNILSATKYNPTCNVALGTDMPLMITFNDEISTSCFIQILAPRMETQEYE